MNWNIDSALGAMGENTAANRVDVIGSPGPVGVPQPENSGRGAPVPVKVAMVKTASKAVGAVVGGLAEIMTVAMVERPNKKHPNGFICPDIDDDDVETLEQATAEGFLVKYPDADIPWWLGAFLAAGNMYVQAHKARTPRLGSTEPIRPELKSVPPDDRPPPTAGEIKPEPPKEPPKPDGGLSLPTELGGKDGDDQNPSGF